MEGRDIADSVTSDFETPVPETKKRNSRSEGPAARRQGSRSIMLTDPPRSSSAFIASLPHK